MIRAVTHVDLWAEPGDPPEWDGNSLRFEGATLHLPCGSQQEAATWCRTLGVALLAHAEELHADRREGLRLMADANQLVAKLRRNKGEIADDGWCWDCKAGNHEGHRRYNEGRCYGCSCDQQPAAVDERTA